MREPRQHLQAVDHARAVAVEEVAVDGVEPTRPDGGEVSEPLPLLAHHRVTGRGAPLGGAVPRQEDHLRALRDRRLRAVARIGLGHVRRHRIATGQPDQLGDHRAAPGDHERVGPQHVEDAGPRERGHPRRHVLDAAAEGTRQGQAGLGPARQLAQADDRGQHVLDRLRGHLVHGDADAAELLERLLAVPRAGERDHVRPERHDRLQARRDHAPHPGLPPRLWREVAEVCHAHQPILGAESEQDLGDAGHEGDDARGAPRAARRCVRSGRPR